MKSPVAPRPEPIPPLHCFPADVRALRDRVFGQPISDKEWENCQDKWMNDVPWLLAECAKLDAREAV